MAQQKPDPFAQYAVTPSTPVAPQAGADPFAQFATKPEAPKKPFGTWDAIKTILGNVPLGPGMRTGLDVAQKELTDPENISVAGGTLGGMAGGAAGGALVGGPIGVPIGAVLGAFTGGTAASKFGEGKDWGPAMQEGATEAVFEVPGAAIGKLMGLLKGPLQKLGRNLGYTALDPSPATLAQIHEAVNPGERFVPEEASRFIKDKMFDMSGGAPGSLRYAKGMGSQLDDMHPAMIGALERTGKSTGVGIEELVAGLQKLRQRTNTPGGALDIPKNLSEIDNVEALVRNRPQGDWRPQTRGELPAGPLTTVGTPEQSAVFVDDAFPMPNRERSAVVAEAAGTGTTTRPNVTGTPGPNPLGRTNGIGDVMASHTPTQSMPPGVQYSGEQLSTPPAGATAGSWSRSGLFDGGAPPASLGDDVPTPPRFDATALTLPEANQLKMKLDDALLAEYGKSAPAAMAGIRVPESANVQALKDVRLALKNFIEQRAAGANYRGADTTVAALNDAMHKTIPFERMAAEATGRERGGPGLRIAAGRNGPRISLFEYLSRRTAGYGARPAMAAGEFAGTQGTKIGSATSQGLRALMAAMGNSAPVASHEVR